ncbi:hypothetical protein ABZ234_03975 [Nocardiopsis sp. NPDC006198]|uniref:hypothetical protein n=1 Tax=Nocardiopsis sp. NPDC006198 TaxID=3154472 RepID=UPI0033A9FC8A
MSYMAVNRLLYSMNGYPPSRRISQQRAQSILSVPVPTAPPDTLSRIDASGTRRRCQALAVLGWSIVWQARQIGMVPGDLHGAVRGDSGVAARTAAKIQRLYDQYWNRTPPASVSSTLARRAAEQRGWLPPLAWDDDLIDLSEADLAAELSRRVDAMDDEELRRCSTAYKAEGDRSPLISAAAREWRRRLESDRAAA